MEGRGLGGFGAGELGRGTGGLSEHHLIVYADGGRRARQSSGAVVELLIQATERLRKGQMMVGNILGVQKLGF